MDNESATIEIYRVSPAGREKAVDYVIHEIGVVIEINGELYDRVFCLPSYLEEMVLGRLVSSGYDPSWIGDIVIKQDDTEVHIYAGVSSQEPREPQKVRSETKISEEEVYTLAGKLDEKGLFFRKTGGTHVVGVCGDKSIFVEDISRHCAIDKIIGLGSISKIDLSRSVLVTSCRQTASTMRKVISTGFPIVISLSAPTELAAKMAREFGITLIGFARKGGFNIYSQDWRILRQNTTL